MLKNKNEPVDLATKNWSPVSIFEDMDRIFTDIRARMIVPVGMALPGERARIPMLDIREEKDLFLIQAELPGMNRENVTIETDGDMLQITALKERDLEQKEEGYLRKERGSMRFFRQIPMPDNLDRESIRARMENGVLEITLPKMPVPERQKNKIEVE